LNLPTAIYGLCLLVLLWHLINGWRKGPARMLIKIFALAAGYVAALLLGEVVAPLLKPLGFADVVNLVLARAQVALIAYFIAVGCGAILFKRTGQQELGLVRFLYGVSGAAIGLAFGAVMVWLLLIFVRVTGLFTPPAASGDGGGMAARILGVVRDWKGEIENGPVSGIVKAVDPLRERDYETAERAGQLIGNPERLRRFWESAALREWAADERVKQLANDQELQKLVTARDFAAFLRHPRVVAFMNDPELIARARRTDFEAALREAVPELKKAK
jgi:hypothetical protein